MSDPWVFLLALLAAYRVTRLVTTDKIAEPVTERIRWWFERRWHEKHNERGSADEWNSKWAYMLSCPWCLGFWVSGVMSVLLSVAYGFDYLTIIGWLAMSAGIGLIARLDSD
jgi:hypothetical protein